MPSDPRTDPIRQAVACGEFPKALALWEEHARQLRRELQTGVFSPERLAETRELVEWCCNVALCARAQAQVRLDQITVARQYGPPRHLPASRISARA
jgi:hypothetical protein